MDLNRYVYFDIECVIRPDAKERLLDFVTSDLAERKPSEMKAVHGNGWTDVILDWDVQSITEYVKDSRLDPPSLLELTDQEMSRKRTRKGVISLLKKELEDATSPPVLDKEYAMMPDAAQIVAIGWKEGTGPVHAVSDIDAGLTELASFSGRMEYCGWNIESYDMPIVQLECIRRGIEPPVVGYRFSEGMFDLHKKTKWWAGCRKLTVVALALGCKVNDPLKGGFEVQQRYENGDMESILGHVHADVQRLYHIAKAYEHIL